MPETARTPVVTPLTLAVVVVTAIVVSAVVASSLVLVFGGGGLGFGGDSSQAAPTNTSANVTGLVSENAVASFTQRGPDGYVEFEEESDGNWTVTVNVTDWNDYQMLLVYAYQKPYSEEQYLHPGDNSVTLTDVPRDAFVDLHIPVNERYGLGYVWEKEYWLNNSVRGNSTDHYESDVLIVAVDQNYSTKAEEDKDK